MPDRGFGPAWEADSPRRAQEERPPQWRIRFRRTSGQCSRGTHGHPPIRPGGSPPRPPRCGPARAGAESGAAPARSCHPRFRTSRRWPGRTRGSPGGRHIPDRRPWPLGWTPPLGKEQVGIDTEAVGVLLPGPFLLTPRCRREIKHLSHPCTPPRLGARLPDPPGRVLPIRDESRHWNYNGVIMACRKGSRNPETQEIPRAVTESGGADARVLRLRGAPTGGLLRPVERVRLDAWSCWPPRRTSRR